MVNKIKKILNDNSKNLSFNDWLIFNGLDEILKALKYLELDDIIPLELIKRKPFPRLCIPKVSTSDFVIVNDSKRINLIHSDIEGVPLLHSIAIGNIKYFNNNIIVDIEEDGNDVNICYFEDENKFNKLKMDITL